MDGRSSIGPPQSAATIEIFRGPEVGRSALNRAYSPSPKIGAILNPTFCSLVGTCGGCPWGHRDVSDQRQQKINEVRALHPSPRFVELPSSGLRDRVDLTWWRDADDRAHLGLYHLTERRIVDLPECPMMSPALESFFREFRAVAPQIRRGSVRLRVAPDGTRGAWLDFANVDVKALFDERRYLRWLNDFAFVEIGQRRKALRWDGDQPKLGEAELRPWFETYGADGRPIPLFGPVGGFSQSGFTGNRALIEAVTSAAARAVVPGWLELFGGNGNFALALAARGADVEVVEVDDLATRGLTKSLAARPELNVTVHRLDAYLAQHRLPPPAGRGVLVDPPRGGLRRTLAWIGETRPPAVLYVSCHAEVFGEDAARLKEFNYRLESLVAVDQFAHSPHVEWVGLFKV